jgi:hypothetical protein
VTRARPRRPSSAATASVSGFRAVGPARWGSGSGAARCWRASCTRSATSSSAPGPLGRSRGLRGGPSTTPGVDLEPSLRLQRLPSVHRMTSTRALAPLPLAAAATAKAPAHSRRHPVCGRRPDTCTAGPPMARGIWEVWVPHQTSICDRDVRRGPMAPVCMAAQGSVLGHDGDSACRNDRQPRAVHLRRARLTACHHRSLSLLRGINRVDTGEEPEAALVSSPMRTTRSNGAPLRSASCSRRFTKAGLPRNSVRRRANGRECR